MAVWRTSSNMQLLNAGWRGSALNKEGKRGCHVKLSSSLFRFRSRLSATENGEHGGLFSSNATRRKKRRESHEVRSESQELPARSAVLRAGSLAAAYRYLFEQSFSVAWAGERAPDRPVLRPQTSAEKKAIKRGLSQVKKSKAPVLLRLVFHDAGTYDKETNLGGSNGSIRFELERPESKGLKRGWRVIEELRDTILKQSNVAISYADLVVICGAWAVEVCGGPKIVVPVGREDSDTADAENMIPNENIPIKDIKAAFKRMNLNTKDLVTLSGSHALGGKGFGEPLEFDNVYYKTLLEKPWESSDSMKQMIGIPSDHVLPDDAECRKVIEEFAANQDLFFESFVSSYNKLTSLGYTVSA